MARPRSFDLDEALTKAMRVFWAKGYEGTSMTDLMEAMELHKGSIYQAFGDKHQLFKAALTKYMSTGMAGIRSAIESASGPFEAVRRFMQMSIRQCVMDADARGCFMMNSAVELAPQDQEVRSMVAGIMGMAHGFLTELIAEGQAIGEFRKDMEPEAMAEYLMAVKSGLLTAGKVGVPGLNPMRAIETALQSLTPDPNPQAS